MVDWKKYEVPDWVVDDYNSRVSKEDRIPLGKYASGDSEDDWITPKDYISTKENKVTERKEQSILTGTPNDWNDPESDSGFFLLLGILFFVVFALVLSNLLA